MPKLAKNSNRLKDVSLDDVGVSFEENRLEGVSLNTPSFSIPENQPLDVPAVIEKSYKVSDISSDLGLPRSATERWYHFLDEPKSVTLPIDDIVSAAPVKTPEGKPTYSGQLIGGMIEMATHLADAPRTLVMFVGTLPETSGSILHPEGREGMTPEQVRTSMVYRAAQVVSERAQTGKDFLLRQHPEWEQDPPKSVMDLLKHPSKLAKNVLRAIPLLAGAGFAVASGHAGAGMLLMFTSEKGASKTNFLANGATEDEAERASNIYGVVATTIEYLQVRQGLKLVGTARDVVMHRAAQKVAKEAGKSLTKELGITAVLESVEEMSQGTAEDLIGLLMLHQPIEGGVGGFVDRRAQEALIASALSMVSAGGGATLGMVSKDAPVKKVPTKKEVAKFEAAVEARRGAIEKAMQEGRAKDASDLIHEAVVEATEIDTEAKPPAPAAEEGVARDRLGGVDPDHEMAVALKEAVAVRPKTEAEIKAGRKRQVAKAAAIKEKRIAKGDSVEEALLSAAGLKTSPLANYYNLWEPIRDRINASNPGAIEGGFLSIEQNEGLQYFEKRDTADAFRKLIDGESLTLRQVDLIKTQFGIEMGDAAKAHAKKNSLAEKAVALWRAGLLTGIKTSGLNILSNLGHGLTETAIDLPAAGFDSVASLFTGKRTLVFTTKGTLKGVKEGFRKGWQYMKTGIDERHIAEKYEFQRVNFGDSEFAKGLQAYEETIFHLMGAEDQPFYYGAKARSLYSQAYAEGKTKGLKGKDLNDFADARVQTPSDDMLAAAAHDAEVAVYQNKTAIGDIFSAIHQSSVTGKVLVPFSRTPSAVAMQIVNYSPVGAVLEVSKQIQNGEFEQRKFSRAMGRATIGTGALYLGTQLFAAGMINLDYPDNEKERELWKLEGRKPNSIKVDGKWRSVEVLGPTGSLLVVGGYFQRAMDETGSPTKAIITAMAGAGKTFSDQTAIRGLSAAAKAISEPELSFESYFSALAGSAVPTIVADVARATDYTERRTAGPFQKIIGRVPYARKTLPPELDVYGQDMPRYGGNPLEVMIDPTRPVKIRQDIVTDEVRRLWDEGIRVAPTRLGDRQGFKILTPEENTALWRRAGDLVYKAAFSIITGQEDTQDIKYSNLSDEEKGKTIDLVVKKSQNMARAEVAIHKMSTGSTLEELEVAGLVTNDVADMMYNMGAR